MRSLERWDDLEYDHLNLEWINRQDHTASEWLARLSESRETKDRERMEKGQPLQGEITADEREWWRNQFHLVRMAFRTQSKRSWGDVMVDCLSGGIAREAGNPLWTGAMLTLYDRRPIPHGWMEAILKIGGHSNRMFLRGGVVWRVGHKKLGSPQDAGLADLRKQFNVHISATGKLIIGRGKVIHVDGPADDYDRTILYDGLFRPPPPISLASKLPSWMRQRN
jgi:hypothetical protein